MILVTLLAHDLFEVINLRIFANAKIERYIEINPQMKPSDKGLLPKPKKTNEKKIT